MALDKRKILQTAQKHLQKGALDKALKEYQSLLQEDPRDANVRLKVGDIHLRREDKDAALAAYLKVAEQFMADGYDAKAVAIYKQITKIDPKRYDIYLPLSELYQRLGLVAEAMNALQAASDGYQREGKKQEALALVRKMGELDPTNTASRQKVAELMLNAGLQDEALAELEDIAGELHKQGKIDAGVALLERCLALDSKRASTLEQLARLFANESQPAKAEGYATALVDIDPENPDALELLAEVYDSLGREQDKREAYIRLARVYRGRGDNEKARETLQRHVPGEPLMGEENFLSMGTSPTDGEDLPLETGSLVAEPAAEAPPEEIALDLDVSGEMPSLEGEPAPLAADSGAFEGDALEIEDAVDAEAAIETASGIDADLADGFGPALDLEAEPAVTVAAQAAVPPGDEISLGDSSFDLSAPEARDSITLDAPAGNDALALEAAASDDALGLDAPADDDSFAIDEPAADDALTLDAPEVGAAEALAAADLEREFIESLEVDEEHGLGAQPAAESLAAPVAGVVETESSPRSRAEADATVDLGPSGAPEEAPGAGSPTWGASHSTVTSQQIVDDLAEADFLFHQGHHEEAEAFFKRILGVAPSHPQVLLRLGEIAAARGETPTLPDGALEVTAPVVPGLDLEPAPPFAESPGAADDLDDEFGDFSGDDFDEAPPGELPRAPEPAPVAENVTAPLSAQAGARPPERAPEADFDLAAELSDAFDGSAGDTRHRSESAGTEEDALHAIFTDFKRGVERTLGQGDFEAHYDLGIAYREMGLLEDALEQFGLASGAEARRLDCLQLMGRCALDLGRGDEAVAYLDDALAAPGLPAPREAALRFDLGCAHEAKGALARARSAFERVLALDPEFPEVADRLAGLGEPEPEPVEPPAAAAGEPFVTFDDLVAEVEDEATAAPGAPVPAAETAVPAPEPPVPPTEPGDGGTPVPGGERRRGGPPRRKKISFL